MTRRRVLFLTSEKPYPPMGGGKLRDMHLIRLLQERADVEVLFFGDPRRRSVGDEPPPAGTVLTAIARDREPLWRRAVYPLRPYVVNGFSQNMARALRERASPGTLLWISRLALAQYIPLARRLGYRVILDEHNVESALLFRSAWSSPRHWHETLIAAQCAWHERRFCRLADEVVATSDIDAAKLRRLAPHSRVTVIPNSVDAQAYAPARARPDERGTLFFSGTLSYPPNAEGLEWFVEEILPRLRNALKTELPRVVVAGASPSDQLRVCLEQAGVHVEADPPKMLPHLAQASVVFVPLRSGSGTRLKILEAMAAGKAVVSTGKGAEGILVCPGQDLFIADNADSFASAVVRLLRDPSLRDRTGERAVRLIEQRYDWRQARDLIAGLVG